MSLTITAVATEIINSMQLGQKLYISTVHAMDAMQIYDEFSGEKKKERVVAFVHALVIEVGEDWEVWQPLISHFIDMIKSIYKIARSL